MAASENVKELVVAMPSPSKRAESTTPEERRRRTRDKEGILRDADKPAMEKALAEMHAGGRDNVVALVGMLVPEDPPADSKVRHALHALATKVSGMKDGDRKAFAEALASTLDGERPKEVQQFVIRQIQLCGRGEVAPTLGRLLADEALAADATTALLAVRDGAPEQFRAALPKSAGRTRVGIIQALGLLKDAGAVGPLREAVNSPQRDVHLAAVWALANLGDAGSADLLLKAADNADGHDRTAATDACLLLAENLSAAGRKAEARRIYAHLWERPSDGPEDHVKRAAQSGLKAAS
jgi:hypothetical protein